MKTNIIVKTLIFIVALYGFELWGISCSAFASNTNRPIIGITPDIVKDVIWPNMSNISLSECYVNAIIRAGGIPLIIPVNDNEDVIAVQVDLLDGLILSSGDDINPLLYKEEPNINCKIIQPQRDNFERILFQNALSRGIAILGICRGHQLINVLMGGTLYQHIPEISPNCTIKHCQEANLETSIHTVEIKKDSWLSKVLGVKEVIVNSFHHQGVKNIAPGLKVTALSKDGIIEGLEKEEGSFCVGVQWHPEVMQMTSPLMLKIFEAFIKKCEKSKENKRR